MHPSRHILVLTLALTAATPFALAKELYIDPANDEQHLGDRDDILFWSFNEQVAGYRNIEKISPARIIPARDDPLPLPSEPRDLDSVVIAGDFEEQPFSLTLDEFFDRQRTAGLLVLKDGVVVYERYGLGNNEETRWLSFSVTKSVVSMLFGAAIRDGYIKSVDEMVTTYLPRLEGSVYDRTAIVNLLQMASGVAWNEDYDDPESDINQAEWETLALYGYLGEKPRAAPPGEVFNYNTAETNLAGNLLRAAIGNNLSTYLHHTIWQPFGMEADAYWPLTEEGGGEFGGCCIAATLRDYARIGLFALNGGKLPDGTPVLADGWMEESTRPSKAADYYGYFWWLAENDTFAASGVFGQGIYIDPAENLVIAIQSAREAASHPRDRRVQAAMLRAVTQAVSARQASRLDVGAQPSALVLENHANRHSARFWHRRR